MSVFTLVSREYHEAETMPAIVIAAHDDGTFDLALPCMESPDVLCHWQPLRRVEVGTHPVTCDRCGATYRIEVVA